MFPTFGPKELSAFNLDEIFEANKGHAEEFKLNIPDNCDIGLWVARSDCGWNWVEPMEKTKKGVV